MEKPTENNSSTDQDIKAWYKSVLDDTVQEMIRLKVVSGVAIEATPVWAAPKLILIAKVWIASQKNRFIWTISGPGVVTDHIPGKLATTPKAVANHFALKWQANAEQLREMAANRPMSADGRAGLRAQADKLVRTAESLFDLTTQEQLWK